MLRFSVLGFEDEIKSSLKPWLCYYCGDCSTHCPQGANPGELMMSLRRWLTSKYDWTRLSGLLYRSLPTALFAFLAVAVGVIAYAMSESFVPATIMHTGHLFEMGAIVLVFGIILLPNIIRMWWFVIGRNSTRNSLVSYITEFRELLNHMFTQKRTLQCDRELFRWSEHFVLVISYLALLITTVVFDWFAATNSIIIILGYAESIFVFSITLDFILSRIRKLKERSKFTQPSDWFFVIWLFLLGLTTFAVRLFIDLGILEKNLWLYLLHMIILVQWAIIIVPFGKWTHFLYRSFAMYFAAIKRAKVKSEE
jgi:hypothetical protein